MISLPDLVGVALAGLVAGLALPRPWHKPPARIRPPAQPPQDKPSPESGSVLATMLDLLPDPVVTVQSNGTLLHANTNARHLYGETIHALIRHPALQTAIFSLRDGATTETTFALDVPVRRVIHASIRKVPTDSPHQCLTLAVIADHTRQDAVERTRADFVAYASHELRTPLAAIVGFIETLRGPAADDPEAQQQFLGVMAAQGARMERLIDRLLYLSRVQVLEHQRPRDIVPASAIMDRTMAEAAALIRNTNITLRLIPPVPDVMVRADTDQMVQVLMNLIENAMKYAGSVRPADCVIDVSVVTEAPGGVWPVQEGVVFTVSDNGPGVDPRHLPRLTERFYRIEGKSTKQAGSGLGLSIVKHIVDRHGGKLVFSSDARSGLTCHVWIAAITSGDTTPQIATSPIGWD